MPGHNQAVDEVYDSLVLPMRSIDSLVESNGEEVLQDESEILGGIVFRRVGAGACKRASGLLRVGDTEMIVGKSTPVQSTNVSERFRSLVIMPFIGGFTQSSGCQQIEVGPGDICIDLNNFGTMSWTFASFLFIAIDAKRLQATLRAICGGETFHLAEGSIVGRRDVTRRLWSVVNFIDKLHGEHPHLPTALGLDDQFMRLLALVLLESAGKIDSLYRRWERSACDASIVLDRLVDYIRANSHLNLTLTDLENQSHYTSRHLQNLFRERFDCTPMQFVRRQRLSSAMEKLQTAQRIDTVTSVARECGYRHTSNFSIDFQREFGVKPSTVLRSSRGHHG